MPVVLKHGVYLFSLFLHIIGLYFRTKLSCSLFTAPTDTSELDKILKIQDDYQDGAPKTSYLAHQHSTPKTSYPPLRYDVPEARVGAAPQLISLTQHESKNEPSHFASKINLP
jgi:hypothetical protein